MDYYLNKENTYQRLLAEYNQYSSLVVAYDFDNTIYDYHKNGWQFPQVIQLLRDLKRIGCHLIIFTANTDEQFVKDYCIEHKIPFDGINEDPPFYQTNSRKIYYNILLDDRAGLAEAFEHLTRLVKQIHKIRSSGGDEIGISSLETIAVGLRKNMVGALHLRVA